MNLELEVQNQGNVVKRNDFRIYLQNEFLRRCEEDPKYSQRAFAQLLRCDHSSLAKILKGHRPLGKATIRRFADRLDLGPDEVQEFLRFRERSKKIPKQGCVPVTTEFSRLSMDQFQVISDWYHYAIVEVIRLSESRQDSKWIAKALSITTAEVDFALERLQRTGMLKIAPDGKRELASEGKFTNISQPFYSSGHRKLQKQILQKAITALETVPIAKRDQTSMTMAIDTARIGEAKELIRKFRRDLASFLARGETRDQVYHLSVSLYPLTDLPTPLNNPQDSKPKGSTP